jgi:hypothetical protein
MAGENADDRADLIVLAAIAAAKLVFHLTTSHGYGIFRDELYYIACSEHLGFGYVDHPPLSILLLWLARRTLGDSLLAIRCLVALAGAASVFVGGLIARELGGQRGAQVLAALLAFFAPFYLAVHHFFSMNAFDVLCWALLELIAVRILVRDEPRGWLWFGLVAGLGLQNKYSVAFLIAGLVVGLLLTASRQLGSAWLWLGGAVAALIFLPHLWWEQQHGWVSIEFMRNATARKNVPVTPQSFFVGQILLLHPLAVPIWLLGLGGLLVAPSLRRVRALGIAYLAIFAVFVAQQGKVYYLAPIYPVLFAAGAVMLERWTARRRLRWAMPAATALYVVGGLAILPLAVPILSEEHLIAYQRGLGVEEPQMERNRRATLPQTFADMHGWSELVDTVARVYDQLPAEQRGRAVVLVVNYGEAGAIDFLGRSRGLPRAISGHNNYWLWGPGDLRGDDTVIAVGPSREDLEAAFEQVERVDTVRCQYCMPYENDLPVHVVRGLRAPVNEYWQRLKRFV